MLFFVLSGYWVTRLYLANRDAGVLNYYRDRILRIWPMLAFVAIVVVAVKVIAHGSYYGSLVSTLGLLGLAIRHGDVVGVAWSLDIELQFYLLLPLVITLAVFMRSWILPALLLAYCLGLFMLWHDVRTVFAYIPASTCGAYIGLTRYSPPVRTAIISLAVFAAALLVVPLIPATRPLMIKIGEVWWNDTGFMALCVLALPFIAWNVNSVSGPFDRLLGNAAFPFYLSHFPIITMVVGWTPSRAIDNALALVLSAIVTAILYAWFDRPIEAWRRNFRNRASFIPTNAVPAVSA